MKKPKLRKYLTGGTTPAPTKKPVIKDNKEFVDALSKYKKINQSVGVPSPIASYVKDSLRPELVQSNAYLDAALRKKYKLSPTDVITGKMILSKQEGIKVLGADKYKTYTDKKSAYSAYRDKTDWEKRNPETKVFTPQIGPSEDLTPAYDSVSSTMFNTPYVTNLKKKAYGGVQKFYNGGTNQPVTPAAYDNSGVNNTIDSTASTVAPWYGLAKGASNMGKSMVKTDEFGNPTNTQDKQVNALLTPHHEFMVSDVKQGNIGKAVAETFLPGIGYESQSNAFGLKKGIDKVFGETKTKEQAAKEQFDSEKAAAKAYEQTIQNNMYHTYAQGGIHSGMPTAEVEKQEVMRMPDGSTPQVDGASHENGGIPVNIPDGTQIFSDRLKDPITKKTFAKVAEKYKTNKQEKIINNPKADKTAKSTAQLIADIKNKKLDALFQTQEQLKQTKLNKYAEKLGLSNQFRNGGTKLPTFDLGGGFGYIDPRNLQLAQQAQSGLPPMEQAEDPSFNDNAYYPIPFMKPSEAERLKNERPNSKQQYVPNPNDPYEQAMTAGKEFEQPAKPGTPGRTNYDWVEPTANTLMQNAGNIMDLAMTRMGKKYDKENYGQVTPNLYNPADALRQADIEARVTRDRIKDASGGNAGALMSNLQQSQAINTMNKSKIRTDASNMNNQVLNDFAWRNKDLNLREISDTKQNKARSEDIARQAVRGIGTNTSAAYRDYKAGKMDQNTAKMISTMFANYKLDMNNPQHFEWVFKTVNQSK